MNIDQMDRYADAVARIFHDKGPIAFVATMHDHEGEYGPGLGVAVEGEKGFYPLPKFYFAHEDYDVASDKADALNYYVLKLKNDRACQIIGSTMGGRR